MPKLPNSGRPPGSEDTNPVPPTAAADPAETSEAAEPRPSTETRFNKVAVGGYVPPVVVRSAQGHLTKFPLRTKRVIAIATDKGGVGKSTIMTQLVQWYLDVHPGLKIRAFDPDNANRTLLAFQPHVTEFVDVDQERSLDAPVLALMTKYDVIVYDGLGSQQTRTFVHWTEEVSFYQIAESQGIAPTFVLIVEEDADVIEQALRVLGRVGNKVDWIAVRTHKSSENMSLWDNSRAREMLLEKLGGVEIFFPKIMEHLAHKLQELRLPLSLAGQPEQGLHLFDQQRVVNLTSFIYREFDKVESLLIPPAAAPAGQPG